VVGGEVSGAAEVGEGVSFPEEVAEVVIVVTEEVSVGVAVEEVAPGVAGGATETTTALGAEVMEAVETTIAMVAEETAMEMITTVVAEILGLQGIAVDRQWGVAGIYPVKNSTLHYVHESSQEKRTLCLS
jgi:hypothetical protein